MTQSTATTTRRKQDKGSPPPLAGHDEGTNRPGGGHDEGTTRPKNGHDQGTRRNGHEAIEPAVATMTAALSNGTFVKIRLEVFGNGINGGHDEGAPPPKGGHDEGTNNPKGGHDGGTIRRRRRQVKQVQARAGAKALRAKQ